MDHMRTSQKRNRKRAIPYIFGPNDRLHELFWQLLDDGDPSLRAYVYRVRGTEKDLPALFTGEPFNGLAEWLRDEHKGGNFHIIIRRGKRMELSGIICIGTPPVQR
jgi:hypothetical protein